MSDPIAADQWVVTGTDAHHRRSWSVTVRASTEEGARRAGWAHQCRPAWASRHTVRAVLATADNDPTVRWGLQAGLIGRVS
jgi:hypothetical protein